MSVLQTVREVIESSVYHHMTNKDIANVTEIPEPSVRRATLRLEADGVIEPAVYGPPVQWRVKAEADFGTY